MSPFAVMVAAGLRPWVSPNLLARYAGTFEFEGKTIDTVGAEGYPNNVFIEDGFFPEPSFRRTHPVERMSARRLVVPGPASTSAAGMPASAAASLQRFSFHIRSQPCR